MYSQLLFAETQATHPWLLGVRAGVSGAMAGCDYVMKPSLSRYLFKPDTFEQEHEKNIGPEDPDEHFLHTVETRVEVAMRKFAQGDTRAAVHLIRQTYRLAEAHDVKAAKGSYVPVAGLCKAILRLQLAVALSRIARHRQALDEARAAKLEMDEFWKAVFQGRLEADESLITGDTTKPAPPMKRMLSNPPPWLSRAVEVTVQSRQSVALESEFVGPLQDSDAEKAAWRKELQRLHQEAVDVARELLEDGDPVRARAEKGLEEARLRAAQAESESFGTRKARSYSSLLAATIRPKAAESSDVPQVPEEPDRIGTAPTATSFMDVVNMAMQSQGKRRASVVSSTSTRQASRGQSAPAAEKETAEAPEEVEDEELEEVSPDMRWRKRMVKGIRKAGETRKALAASGRSALGMDLLNIPPEARNNYINPFKDWRLNVMEENRMSYSGTLLQDFEGMSKLQENLRFGKVNTTLHVKETPLDELGELRVMYNDAGVKSIAGRSERRRLRESNPELEMAAAKREQELFAAHNIHPSRSTPSLRDTRKLFAESVKREQRRLGLAQPSNSRVSRRASKAF